MLSYWWVGDIYVVAFGLVIVNGLPQWSVDDTGCRTPDRGIGDCVHITECQHMVNLLQDLERPIPPVVAARIHAYTCGADKEGYKVCCPPDPITVGTKPPKLSFHERTEPPDVTNHTNIRLLPERCGYFEANADKIVNGNNSFINEFPWMALLQYRVNKSNKLKFACGGSVINKNYILTAAHCIEDSPETTLVSVRVGEYSIKNETDCDRRPRQKNIFCNPPVQDLAIEEIIHCPGYGGRTGKFVNDIGLIRVSTINLEAANVKPVCLPIGKVRDTSYNSVMVTGWGVTNPWTGDTADILQKVGLSVADRSTCLEKYKDSGIQLTNTQICVGGGDKDSCGGDSGGPMLVPTPVGEDLNVIYVQQGLVSFGSRLCGNTGYPGIYTAVKYYMDWILDTIRE